MYKLLVIDDEEFICQSIAELIDWKSYDISLCGICMDGVDAYHMILDELPDIVITDIRMPGISGLELIERIHSSIPSTQFIILSGYGEFEYAKKAMKYGVKHYLLKPCDEKQLRECILDVVKDCDTAHLIGNNSKTPSKKQQMFQKTLIYNLIREGISTDSLDDDFFMHYSHYVNLGDTTYQICFFYYLIEDSLKEFCHLVREYFNAEAPGLDYYCVYVSNVFLLFFPGFETDFNSMDMYFSTLTFQKDTVEISYKRESYPDMLSLLKAQIPKIKRFDSICFIDCENISHYYNYNSIVAKINKQLLTLTNPNISTIEKTVSFSNTLDSITNKTFLIQLIDHLLISLNIKLSNNTLTSITDFLCKIRGMNQIEDIRTATIKKVNKIIVSQNDSLHHSAFIDKLIQYTKAHLSEPNLTLKWICENYLYMNVNYVSRIFLKETGEKFTYFLIKLRVEKAKELFNGNKSLRIQDVAVLVGCGNNPYYFSKIFKKITGITPTAYLNHMIKWARN